MNNERTIYLSSEIRNITLITALCSVFFITAIILLDKSNPNIYLLIITLTISVLVCIYSSKEIVLDEKGIVFNGKNIEWTNLVSVEKGIDLILKLSGDRKIRISNNFDSFYDIVHHIKNYRKDLFDNTIETHFNNSFYSRYYLSVRIIIVTTAVVLIFYNHILISVVLAIFLLLLPKKAHYKLMDCTVILKEQSILIKYFFRTNLNRSYCEIKEVELIDKGSYENIVIKFSDGKKKKLYNHSNNCQFLYDNLLLIKNKNVLVEN